VVSRRRATAHKERASQATRLLRQVEQLRTSLEKAEGEGSTRPNRPALLH
jgi:hypothetical protein